MKLKVFKQNFTTVYLTVLVIIFSLQGGFIKSPIIKYADEIFALYAMIGIVINLKKLKKDKKKYRRDFYSLPDTYMLGISVFI